MKKPDILLQLEKINLAKTEWATEVTEFNDSINVMMRRLLHEAAAAFMSPEEVARASGFTVKRVRQMMRDLDLNPRDGKRLLSQKAAEALANNAALLGIEPEEMDLMSPLAYLPMGGEMKRALRAEQVDKANAEPEVVSGNPVIDELERVRDEAADYCNLISNHAAQGGCTCFTVIKQIDNRIARLAREAQA